MNLHAKLQQIATTIGAALPTRKMLALDLSNRLLMGAVVERQGKRIRIVNFVSVDRGKNREDLPDQVHIAEIMERLHYSSGPVVLVTPMARSVQISMNRAKVEKLRHFQLCDSLRWEVEPYTGISGTHALVGAVRGVPAEQEDLMLLTEEEEELDVQISVIERNVYRAMKQVCRRCGLKLVRLYPPEVCFYMPLFLEPDQPARAVFEIGIDYAHFALVKAGRPKQISTVPLGRDVLLELMNGEDAGDIETHLRFILDQVPGPLPLVLTGNGATRRDLSSFLNVLSHHGAEPLHMARRDKLAKAEHDALNAMFAVAVGGAVRELSGPQYTAIGISDKVPLDIQLRQSAYILPVAVAVVLALGMFGHYGYMKQSNAHYKARNAELQAQIKERKKAHDEYLALQKQIDAHQESLHLFSRRIEFLEGGSDSGLEHLERVLGSLSAAPAAMLLDTVEHNGSGEVVIQGSAARVEQIGDFAVRLQNYSWCRAAELKKISQQGNGRIAFEIKMTTVIEEEG